MLLTVAHEPAGDPVDLVGESTPPPRSAPVPCSGRDRRPSVSGSAPSSRHHARDITTAPTASPEQVFPVRKRPLWVKASDRPSRSRRQAWTDATRSRSTSTGRPRGRSLRAVHRRRARHDLQAPAAGHGNVRDRRRQRAGRPPHGLERDLRVGPGGGGRRGSTACAAAKHYGLLTPSEVGTDDRLEGMPSDRDEVEQMERARSYGPRSRSGPDDRTSLTGRSRRRRVVATPADPPRSANDDRHALDRVVPHAPGPDATERVRSSRARKPPRAIAARSASRVVRSSSHASVTCPISVAFADSGPRGP